MNQDNLLYSALKEQQLYNALKELVTIYDFENDPQRLIRTPKDIKNAWIDAKQALSTYESSADSTEGIRWVKASERLPEANKSVITKHCSLGDNYLQYRLRDDIIRMLENPFTHKNVEWLDESPKPSTIQGEGEEKIYSQSEMDAAINNVTELTQFTGSKQFEEMRAQMENITKENYALKHPQPTVTQQGKEGGDEYLLRNCIYLALIGVTMEDGYSLPSAVRQQIEDKIIRRYQFKSPKPIKETEGEGLINWSPTADCTLSQPSTPQAGEEDPFGKGITDYL